jgi:hypothetical protein
MYTVLLTYGLNPIEGLKVMVRSPQQSLWKQLWQQVQQSNLTFGALVPTNAETLSKVQVLTRLKFFVALEGDTSPTQRKALPGSTSVGLQVYQHQDGETTYKAEVVRWRLGKSPELRRRYR